MRRNVYRIPYDANTQSYTALSENPDRLNFMIENESGTDIQISLGEPVSGQNYQTLEGGGRFNGQEIVPYPLVWTKPIFFRWTGPSVGFILVTEIVK